MSASHSLTQTQATLLRILVSEGPLTRPELTDRSELSSPTVIHVIAELEELRLVDHVDSRQGARGRAAQVYGLGQRSGWVLGVDLGTNHAEFVAVDLTGRVVESHRVAVQRESESSSIGDTVRGELARFRTASNRRFGALRQVGLAVATIVPPSHRHYRRHSTSDIVSTDVAEATATGPSFDLAALIDSLGLPRDCEVTLENNINCSAFAESRRPERGGMDLLYLHLGQGGVGIGVVSDGRLLRGATGSAGEMRWFPYPFGLEASEPSFTLEEYFGARGFLARVRRHYQDNGRSAPSALVDVFAQAASGDRFADDVIDEYAGNVALALAAFISVTDPEVGVLGGGLGNNAVLVERVGMHLAAIGRPLPLTGDLGETSSAQGAAVLALDVVRRSLGVSR